MSLINKAASQLDQADLIILANVETLRHQQQPATASALASLIGGAPVGGVIQRLRKLRHLGLIEIMEARTTRYQLTLMGAELLSREMPGWTPSPREQIRRDAHIRSAGFGAWG